MSVAIRPQPYRLDPSHDSTRLPEIIANVDLMLQILFEDLAALAAATSSTAVTGATGATGAQGVPATDGVDGQDGLTIVGPAGAAGAIGLRGVPGADGQDADDQGVIGVPMTFGTPTASVGLTAVNGSASSAMKSDAAPALDQSIIPTWTGAHLFKRSANSVTAFRIQDKDGNALFDADSTNRRIGINREDPLGPLHVKQTVNDQALFFESNADDTVLKIAKRAAPDVWVISATFDTTGGYKPITFLTSDTERIRIRTDGNVGIGSAGTATSRLNISGLPTSAAGLAAGDVWSNAGVLTIV